MWGRSLGRRRTQSSGACYLEKRISKSQKCCDTDCSWWSGRGNQANQCRKIAEWNAELAAIQMAEFGPQTYQTATDMQAQQFQVAIDQGDEQYRMEQAKDPTYTPPRGRWNRIDPVGGHGLEMRTYAYHDAPTGHWHWTQCLEGKESALRLRGVIGATKAAAAVQTLLGAAGVSASAPVAGWIAAGLLVTAASIIGVVSYAKRRTLKVSQVAEISTAYGFPQGAAFPDFILEGHRPRPHVAAGTKPRFLKRGLPKARVKHGWIRPSSSSWALSRPCTLQSKGKRWGYLR